jgi:two-component sensor histidine kinase
MAVYFVIGTAWILFSDNVLAFLVHDPARYARFQTVKGWFYVAATSVLFGLFAFAELRRLAEMRNRAEEDERRIAAMLEEKNALVRELHHRVKNNLQLISSLIALRMDTLPTNDTRRFFAEFLLRIKAISLAQDKLYALNDLSGIDLGELVRSVVEGLSEQFKDRPVRFTMDTEGNILIRLEKGVPLSLAVNEILLNAVAHAFPDGRPGHVAVELAERDTGLLLCIRDDGVGFDPEKVPAGSIGFALIEILVGQAGGSVEYESPLSEAGGTEVRITVQEEKAPSEKS